MDFKRALVRPQKGTFYKPISRLLEAKRPRFDFELYENSLQISNKKEISCLQKIDIHGINLYFTLQFILLCESNRYKKVISCKCITLYSIHNQKINGRTLRHTISLKRLRVKTLRKPRNPTERHGSIFNTKIDKGYSSPCCNRSQ